MNNKPKILSRTIHCQSKLFTIERIALEFNNQQHHQFERIIAPGAGAVLIIPVLDNQHVIMIREYCVGTEQYELTFPKGKIEYFGLITHVVLAEDLQPEKLTGDEPEELQQIICDINNISALIKNENLREARSIAAFYQVRDILHSRQNDKI